MAFKLRSGNKPAFKMVGSSPLRHPVDGKWTGHEHNSKLGKLTEGNLGGVLDKLTTKSARHEGKKMQLKNKFNVQEGYEWVDDPDYVKPKEKEEVVTEVVPKGKNWVYNKVDVSSSPSEEIDQSSSTDNLNAGNATNISGDLSSMPYHSAARIQEYNNRNWAMDHTTDKSITKPSEKTVKVPTIEEIQKQLDDGTVKLTRQEIADRNYRINQNINLHGWKKEGLMRKTNAEIIAERYK